MTSSQLYSALGRLELTRSGSQEERINRVLEKAVYICNYGRWISYFQELSTGDFLLSTRFQRENETRDEYVGRIKKGVEFRINTENYILPYPYDIEVMEAITEICPSTTTCVGGHWSIFSMKEVEGYLSLIKKLYSEAVEK